MKSPAHKAFAKSFEKIKKEKGISHADIKKSTGISFENLWHYAKGSSVPRPDTLQVLAKALGVSVDRLLGVI